VIIEPAFSEYERGISASGRRIGRVTLSPDDHFALHLQPIEAELRKGCDLLVVANPGNPTGRYYPLSQMEPLVALADRHGAVTLVDEAFIDFVPGGESALPLLSRYPRLLVLRSLTKFYALPGLRLGYVAAGVEIAGRVAALRDRWSVNTLAQAAGVAALGDHHYRAQTLSVIPREREGLRDHLARAGVETAVHYPLPLHLQPPFRESSAHPCPVAERAAREVLSLPLYPHLTDGEQDAVIAAVRSFYRAPRG
jgi:threonine-phosphate decarboxylase